MNYYNENDPYCVQWLGNLIAGGLIPDGHVDGRSIRDVQPSDLEGYRQCHFFAGIAGWSLALSLAEWPEDREVWTGSCPCQPFSSAGARKGFADDRHLWPEFKRLIEKRRPAIVFGEQVTKTADWLALVRSDLEALDYAMGAIPIEAASVGALHLRDRFWFVAHAHGHGEYVRAIDAEVAESSQPVAHSNNKGLEVQFNGHTGERATTVRACPCVPVEPGMGRMAYGVSGRVDQLRALGNAIVPQVAAEFIRAAA